MKKGRLLDDRLRRSNNGEQAISSPNCAGLEHQAVKEPSSPGDNFTFKTIELAPLDDQTLDLENWLAGLFVEYWLSKGRASQKEIE